MDRVARLWLLFLRGCLKGHVGMPRFFAALCARDQHPDADFARMSPPP